MLGDTLFLSSRPRAFPGTAVRSEYAAIRACLMRTMLCDLQRISPLLYLIQLSPAASVGHWPQVAFSCHYPLEPFYADLVVFVVLMAKTETKGTSGPAEEVA